MAHRTIESPLGDEKLQADFVASDSVPAGLEARSKDLSRREDGVVPAVDYSVERVEMVYW